MSSNHFASASLYVGDLNPLVTEAHLYEVFNSVASVASVRVCRDAQTRHSLSYAYVNYHSVQDAERAMDRLNFTSIKGQPCRIMWCNRDPTIRRSGDGNVFVKNLDKSLDNKALYDTFSLFGNILSCKIGTGENGESLGYGFVHFESDEAAQKAIERVNGLTLANQVVYVASHVPKSERQGVKEAMFTNIYVKNFPQEWTQSEFDAVFRVYGEITSSAIRADARGRCFGFVNFETNHAAREAVNELNGRVILEGSLVSSEDNAAALEDNPEAPVLYVARSQSRVERQQYLKEQYQHNKQAEKTRHTGENLYVKNLPEDVDDDRLLEMFSSFGPVTSAKAMTDERGKCRGFGFVCFHSAEDAARAVTDMHGKLAGGKPLYVTIAERRDTRTSRLQNHRMQGPRPPMMFSGQVPPSYMYPQQLGRPMMAAQNYMWRPQQGPGGR